VPLPRRVGRFNKAVTNRLTQAFAPRAPGFGVIVHRGRRSGRTYRTPVNAFGTTDGYVFALTYGPEVDWVKNVLAAGAAELETRGRRIGLRSPRVVHDQSRRLVPPLVRLPLLLLGVADFLVLERA
jgi:deazaflavin-dependent oxidoreductase (nitroreductase family)